MGILIVAAILLIPMTGMCDSAPSDYDRALQEWNIARIQAAIQNGPMPPMPEKPPEEEPWSKAGTLPFLGLAFLAASGFLGFRYYKMILQEPEEEPMIPAPDVPPAPTVEAPQKSAESDPPIS